MKKALAILILIAANSAFAQHGHHGHHGHHGYRHNHYHGGGGWGWVAPALIGGAVVYAATRPPVVVQQPPVIVQQPSDIVYIDGVAYRKQLMLVNGAYQEVLIRM